MTVEGGIQASLDMEKPMSKNVVFEEIDEQVMSMWVIFAEIIVSGEVILGYISPSRSEVPTKTPMRNLGGIRVLAPLD